MKMQSKPVRRFLQFALVATVLALSAGSAHAARRWVEFWPLDFEAQLPAAPYTQTPTVLRSNFADNTSGGGVSFWVPLKLPAGSRLHAVELVYSTDASPAPLFNMDVIRVGFGGGEEQLLSVGGDGSTGGVITTIGSTTPIDPDDLRKLVIAPGYRYYVVVYSHNKSTRIHGSRVRYATP